MWIVLVCAASVGLNAALLLAVDWLWRARMRTYDYAVWMTRRFPLDHPANRAYSDMATVIVLDGKATPKEWADA